MLQVADLSFAYGRDGARSRAPLVLRHVTFEVARGRVVGVLGPNGSGKTTLLRLAAGTLTPLEGRVMLDGVDIAQMTRRQLARRRSVVPQDSRAAFDLSALEVVLMGRYAHLGPFELEGAGDLAIARDALDATGTAALARRAFGTLSGGERQRIVIASALAQAADLMLLDEPTTALDLRYQIEIAELVRRLNRERGTTFLISTHDLNLAAALCGELILLRDGAVAARGPTTDVLTSANIRTLYGVDADVQYHARAGHVTVVPLAR